MLNKERSKNRLQRQKSGESRPSRLKTVEARVKEIDVSGES